jgi:hypothetical protein
MDVRKEFLKNIPIERATEEALLKVIDEKKARNFLMIKDFDLLILQKKGKIKVVDAYHIIADKYRISYDLVRFVVRQRKLNNI